MSDDTLFDLSVIYHRIRIVQTRKVENGRLWLGGYSITTDSRTGEEISRTENEWNCSLGYDEPVRRRSLWNLLVDWWGGPPPPPKSMEDYAADLGPGWETRRPATPTAKQP